MQPFFITCGSVDGPRPRRIRLRFLRQSRTTATLRHLYRRRGFLGRAIQTRSALIQRRRTTITSRFGVQQDLGFSTLLDVSYVGNLGRHLTQTLAVNTIPYGARFLPQNQDPTTPGKPLPDNFFRPYPGYNNITLTDNAYSSSYDALFVSLKRRFTNGLQLGVSYTYSRYMDFTGNGGTTGTGTLPIYVPLRQWSYGLDPADQTHNFVVDYNI